jgi:hypothetical protein
MMVRHSHSIALFAATRGVTGCDVPTVTDDSGLGYYGLTDLANIDANASASTVIVVERNPRCRDLSES